MGSNNTIGVVSGGFLLNLYLFFAIEPYQYFIPSIIYKIQEIQ